MKVFQLKAVTGEKIALDERYFNRWSHLKISIFNGYPTFYCRKRRKNVFLHKEILSSTSTVDHINRNKLDCRLANLRVATSSQQNSNRKKRKNSFSKFKGVCINRRNLRKKFIAQLVKNNQLYRYSFSDEIQAAKKYDELAKEHFGEFAVLNFPEETIVNEGEMNTT